MTKSASTKPDQGEGAKLRLLLQSADKFLADLVDCKDPDELAADGGITVFQVFQHDAKYLRVRIALTLSTPETGA